MNEKESVNREHSTNVTAVVKAYEADESVVINICLIFSMCKIVPASDEYNCRNCRHVAVQDHSVPYIMYHTQLQYALI